MTPHRRALRRLRARAGVRLAVRRETWEVIVRRGEPLAGLVVRLAWELRVPVDAAETLAAEVRRRVGIDRAGEKS